MDAMKHFTEGMIKENKPQFEVGDTVRVSVRIKEGDKERIQAFEGTVIAKKHGGIAETFTVRRTSYGVGVERVFPVNSPFVEKVDVVRRGKVRRAKLFYLRERTGKAANKPGVTRGKQWISVGNFDLMDMPGVLWKKFDSLETASNLAFIGSIRDDILDIEELACGLLSSVRGIYPAQLLARYKLEESALALPPYDLLQAIGAKRGMLISGGEVDTERAAKMLVGEFRASKWGRLSLERPPQRAVQEEREEVTDDAPQDDWDDEQ